MALTTMATTSITSHRIIQNFHLVWLDENIDNTNDDCRNSITNLQQVVNTVNTFIDVDECIDFITDVEENALMVISERLSQSIIPCVQDIPQVASIYIFDKNNLEHQTQAKQWMKVKGVFTKVTTICEALGHIVEDCDRNMTSISFLTNADGSSNQNVDQLDPSFMYTRILKEILLTIEFKQEHIREFFSYCREQFASNNGQLKKVDMIEKEYHSHQPIWWYTSDFFFYSMVNKALRSMHFELIISMGFFVHDLHNDISTLHITQCNGKSHSDSFTVYRGQGLAPEAFNRMKKTQGGLISFNNFLSTSLDRPLSFAFAESNLNDPNVIGVFFEIKIDPSISSIPFANVGNVSYFQTEKEILFSMHSVFRIRQVTQINNDDRFWNVELTLTDDNDPELHNLTEIMRKELSGSTGWHRLGHLMIKVAQLDKAEELYKILLKQTTNENEDADLIHMLGMIKRNQGKYAEAAEYYEQSIKIKQKILPQSHFDLDASYNNLGDIYENMGEHGRALSYYEQAFKIQQKASPVNYLALAISYNNIAGVYYNMNEHTKSLLYYEKALDLFKEMLPANHPHLATSYNNIGAVYRGMSEHSKALLYNEKTLEIFEKILPEYHPDFAQSYNNIGELYTEMRNYPKAFSYYETAREILEKALSTSHPTLAICYNNIAGMYYNMNKHSEALLHYEKALAIFEKVLSGNHPHLVTSYNNIGMIYDKMGEYSIALSYYEKKLEIQQQTLSVNHPDLATSYNTIGMMYDNNMGEYSKALLYYEKAIEVQEKLLPVNHLDLATLYNNIGVIYSKLSRYLKGVSYYEKALEIKQKTLSENHPDLATSYDIIGMMYSKMNECPQALLYYEKGLEIRQKSLPADHIDLASCYKRIGMVYDNIHEYSKALSYYEKALEIEQQSLAANHPNLSTSYNSIGLVHCKMENYSKALPYFEGTLNIFQHSTPPDRSKIEAAKKVIEFITKKL